MREKLLFDNDWLFHKGDIEVNLPGARDKDRHPSTITMLWMITDKKRIPVHY